MRWVLLSASLAIIGAMLALFAYLNFERSGDPSPTDIERASSSIPAVQGERSAGGRRGGTDEPPTPAPDGDVDLARLMIASSLDDVFPNLPVGEHQIEALAAAALQLRRAETELQELPEGIDTAERRRRLEDEIAAAAEEMARVMNQNLDDAMIGEQSRLDEFDEPIP